MVNYQERNHVARVTAGIIKQIGKEGANDKAVLAALRSSNLITSPRAQAFWPVMMRSLDRDDLSRDGNPTATEIAIYTATKLYAIHQQKSDSYVLPSEGNYEHELFHVLSEIRRNPEKQVALDRRVQPLLIATNVQSVINNLTALIRIISSLKPNVKINYPQIATDLYFFQKNYNSASRIRLRWGEAYFYTSDKSERD